MKRILCTIMILCILFSGAYAQEEGLNVLLLGVDSSRGGQRGRSDTMMLVKAEPSTGEIRLVSFLRDLYVDIPGVGKTRLNAAYHYGGEALLKETLEKQFGISVDRTVTVQFRMLSEIVDAIGGIEVEIAPRELTALNEMIESYNADYGLTGGILDGAGHQTLDGKQALCYSRLRKIDSDFQRTSRQQTVIAGMLERLSAMSTWQLMGLALKYLGKVETDLILQDAARLVPMLTSMEELSFRTAQVPFEGAYTDETVDGMMVLKPDLSRTRKQLAAFFQE